MEWRWGILGNVGLKELHADEAVCGNECKKTKTFIIKKSPERLRESAGNKMPFCSFILGWIFPLISFSSSSLNRKPGGWLTGHFSDDKTNYFHHPLIFKSHLSFRKRCKYDQVQLSYQPELLKGQYTPKSIIQMSLFNLRAINSFGFLMQIVEDILDRLCWDACFSMRSDTVERK